jgi:hypothetical protein
MELLSEMGTSSWIGRLRASGRDIVATTRDFEASEHDVAPQNRALTLCILPLFIVIAVVSLLVQGDQFSGIVDDYLSMIAWLRAPPALA